MKTSRLLALVAALGLTCAAHAAFYTKLSGLYSSSSDVKVDNASSFKTSLKSNAGIAGSVGYKFPFVRAEGELQYFKSNFSGGSNSGGGVSTTGDSKQISGFANAYVDGPSTLGLAPYIGVGLGMTQVDLGSLNGSQSGSNVVHFSGSHDVFAYQVMAGLQFHIVGEATFNVGYRYQHKENMSLTNAATSAKQSVKFAASNIFELGVSLGF